MGWSHGRQWSEAEIRRQLALYVAELGRMPSANELRERGGNDLACALSRHGGFRFWASRIGVGVKESETHRGIEWEDREADFFAELGFEVERQTTRSPFDLLVNGSRIDVKTSTLNSSGWYQFGGVRRCEGCDFLDLLCIEDGALLARFIVPAEKARVTTISMMPSTLEGLGKYAAFLGATNLLAEETRLK